MPAPQLKRPLLRRLTGGAGTRRSLPHGDVFDLRRNTPGNWAHFLTNHLPIVFTLCEKLDITPDRALLVLPANIPRYILAAAEVFRLTVLATDDNLDGEGILYDPAPWISIRAARADWLRCTYVEQALSRLDSDPTNLPKRVFLSRKDTRVPGNEAEIENWLASQGFVKIYPETLSAADQFRLFRQADTIVAVHGAGLAPLLYAPLTDRTRHLVEILPCGHITDVFRVMAQQMGWNWIGVRGRLKPDYVRASYDFSRNFTTYSLDTFDVDLASLKEAFHMAGLTQGAHD